jgi:cardiolipin synthase
MPAEHATLRNGLPPLPDWWLQQRPHWVTGNRLVLLDSGQDYFPVLLATLAQATREIWLETYIFACDATGDAVVAALSAAALRGCKVRVLVDGFGARNFVADYRATLQAAGVECLIHRPELGLFRLQRNRLRRLHRKLVLVDGCIAFVGGINVVDDLNVPPELGPRFDYAVQVEGPLLAEIAQAMRRQWEQVAWASQRRRPHLARTPACICTTHPAGLQRAAFLVRDNLRHRHDIAAAYLQAINTASHEILLAHAYFLPGLRFRHALLAAAQRGVCVTLLLQGRSDHPPLHYATQALYGALLRAGIRIFEYESGFLHAKVAVIDQYWATVGSSNIDPFSLLLAKEANVVVEDRDFASQLKHSLQQVLQTRARELHVTDLDQQPWLSRLLRWTCYGLIRWLFGFTGYGHTEHDT